MPLFSKLAHRRQRRGVFFSTLLLFAAASRQALGWEPQDPQSLINKAHYLKLAEDPGWKRLLHYRQGLFGGEKSDIDGPNFFLSKRGRNDPQAEMDATINAFFEPPSISTDI